MPPFRRRCSLLLVALLLLAQLPQLRPLGVAAAPQGEAALLADSVPTQIVIAFAPGTDEATRDAIVARRGGTTIRRLDSINARLVELPGGQSRTATIADIADEPAVRYAQPNFV